MDPQTLSEVIGALNQTGAEVVAYFSSLPEPIFSGGNEEHWSPGHHIKHLVLSNKPVAHALTWPREKLRVWDEKQPRRSYADIQTLYQGRLGAGARAFGPFLPTVEGSQADAAAEYRGSIDLLHHGGLAWSEPELDQYALPHPVLGLLSVREMLYFTVLHNRHHLSGVKARLEGV